MRFLPLALSITATLAIVLLVLTVSVHFLWLLFPTLPLAVVGIWDLVQVRHSLMRNYPVTAHLRWLFEGFRPEIRQYFIESDVGGSPFNRDHRSLIYERAKNQHAEEPFGTQLDVYQPGYEWFAHSLAPKPQADTAFKVQVGGPGCSKPYAMALLNVSAMSFGALSANAIMALNKGAKLGGFAHDTGEGGLTQYHLEHGGDIIWEIGSAYFGCRTKDGAFDPEMFKDKVNRDSVKCVNIKLSQGAKPGLGGVMPAAKVTQEIADIRGIPVGQKCISPSSHTAFTTPRELLEFVARLRDLAEGRPTGFKLCIGQGAEFLGICKAMLDMEVYPDFIVIDGGEGGTGAAPLEFEDHMGAPLSEGLVFAHNALVGCGLRDKIKIGCSGKVTSGFEMARRIALGADYCNAARGMMFALGCIQAQACNTNKCPVGVTTQDPKRSRALVVSDKAERVRYFQSNTVTSFNQILSAVGLTHPDQLGPSLLYRRLSPTVIKSYDEIYDFLEPEELLTGTDHPMFKKIWEAADPDRFGSL
jgi:glutamate synthase domain-containing protein 2